MKTFAIVTGLLLLRGAFLFTPAENREAAPGSSVAAPNGVDSTRWRLADNGGIIWEVADDKRLPHQDHLEMSGRMVSVIVQYGADANRNLVLSREVYWPTLRTAPGPGEPDWYKYRAYLKRKYAEETTPEVRINGKPMHTGPVVSVGLKRHTDDWAKGRAEPVVATHPLPVRSARGGVRKVGTDQHGENCRPGCRCPIAQIGAGGRHLRHVRAGDVRQTGVRDVPASRQKNGIWPGVHRPQGVGARTRL